MSVGLCGREEIEWPEIVVEEMNIFFEHRKTEAFNSKTVATMMVIHIMQGHLPNGTSKSRGRKLHGETRE